MSVSAEIKTTAKEILDAFTTISVKAREGGTGGVRIYHGGNTLVDGHRSACPQGFTHIVAAKVLETMHFHKYKKLHITV